MNNVKELKSSTGRDLLAAGNLQANQLVKIDTRKKEARMQN